MQEKITNFQEKHESQEDKILKMNPKQLMDYFASLDKQQAEQEIKKMVASPDGLAYLSYWEKYLERDKQVMVDKIVKQKREREEREGDLPLYLEKRFSEKELKFIFSKLRAVQLTFGCSKGCAYCGFDAVAKIREHIPYFQLENLFKRYGAELTKVRPFLYFASEPSDYIDKSGAEVKTYQDVHYLAETYADYSPHVTSSELSDVWLEFLKTQKNNPRLSVYNMDAEKVDNISSNVKNEVRILGKNKKQYSSIGKNFYNLNEDEKKEAYEKNKGIGCFSGFLLTPRGLYNTVVLDGPTDEFPQAQILVPFKEFKDIEINPGDNLKDILPYYVIELFPDRRFGSSVNESPIILKNKIGEKITLMIDVKGTVTKTVDFKNHVDKVSEEFLKNNFEKLLVNKDSFLIKDIDWWAKISNEEVIKQFQEKIKDIQITTEGLKDDIFIFRNDKWVYTFNLPSSKIADNFCIESKRVEGQIIVPSITLYIDVITGEVNYIFIRVDEDSIKDK